MLAGNPITPQTTIAELEERLAPITRNILIISQPSTHGWFARIRIGNTDIVGEGDDLFAALREAITKAERHNQ
jgi:hypothetical protein